MACQGGIEHYFLPKEYNNLRVISRCKILINCKNGVNYQRKVLCNSAFKKKS